MTGITIDFNANLARFTSSLDKATNDLSKFRSNAARVSGNLKVVFAGLGVGLGLAAFTRGIRDAIDAADKLNDLSKSTGLAVESLAGFDVAAKQSGTDLETVAKGINKFTAVLFDAGNGSEEASKKLSRLGLNLSELRAQSPEEQFISLAGALEKFSESDRPAILIDVLGQKMAGLVPLLSDGASGLRNMLDEGKRLNPVTAEMARNADLFNDQMAKLDFQSRQFGLNIAKNLLPALNEVTGAIHEAYKEGGALHAIWIALGGAAAIALGQTNPQIARARLDELTKQLAVAEKQLAAGSLLPQSITENDGVVDRIVHSIIPDIKIKPEYLAKLRTNVETLKKERDAILKSLEPPKQKQSTGTGLEVQKRLCEASGGRFEGGECITKPLPKIKAESVRSFEDYSARIQGAVSSAINDSDVVKAREYADTIAALDKLFFESGLDAEIYASALDKISKAREGDNAAATEYARKLDSLLTDTPVRKTKELQANLQLLDQAFADGAIGAEEWGQAVEKLTTSTDKLSADGKDAFKELKDAIEGWGRASADAFVDFAFTGKTSFGGLIDSVLKDLARLAAYNAFKPLFNSFSDSIGSGNFLSDLFGGGSSGGGGTFFSVTAPSAKGNVFTSPGLSAYSGQIVSSPTLFPFAAGIGLMGEAGPEAILPLSRGSDGKLGVAGGGGTIYNNVVVNVTPEGATSIGDERELGRRIGAAVRSVLVDEKRPGGLLT